MNHRTSRSIFLREALRCYEEADSGALMGLCSDVQGDFVEELSASDNDCLNEMAARIRKAHGEKLQNQRLSLSKSPLPDISQIVADYLQRLSAQGQRVMVDAVHKVLAQPLPNGPAAREDGELEALDAQYAQELVDLLPGVVAKAASLQELEIDRVPKPSVRRYFHEAHRCYFFGLNRACATLCRAILECAFKEVLGSNNRPTELLDLARERSFLDQERLDAADRIFNAGDSAVHHEHIFERNYSDADVEMILLNTRKILEDLYSRSARAGA